MTFANPSFFLAGAAAVALAQSLSATTHALTDQGAARFQEGDWSHLALSNDGRLQPAPGVREMASFPQPVLWEVEPGPEDSLYVATGPKGIVYRVDAAGESDVSFRADHLMTRSLARTEEGLFIGTGPQGQIFRLRPGGGKAEVWADLEVTYIWQLEARDGALWAATGLPARLMRLPLDGGEPEVWWQSNEDHFTTLTPAREGGWYLGSSPDGLVFAVTAKDEGRALYNAAEEEIRALIPRGDELWIAAFSAAKGSNNASKPPTDPNSLPPFVVTANGGNSKPEPKEKPKGQGSLYRWQPDGIVERMWQTREDGLFSLAPYGESSWLFGLGRNGRMVAWSSPSRRSLLEAIPNGSEVSVLQPSPQGLLVGTSQPATLYRLGADDEPPAGIYTSAERDARQLALWGNLEIVTTSELPLNAETRSGNTNKPDATWSDWEPVTLADETNSLRGPIASPPGRYIQYRLNFPDLSASGAVHRVRSFFRLPNAAPLINRLAVLPVGADLTINQSNNTPAIELEKAFQEKPLQTFLQGGQARKQLRQTGRDGEMTAIWQAFDANADPLVYHLRLVPLGEGTPITLARDWEEQSYRFVTTGWPEGYYRFEVTADDAPGNPADEARQGSRRSDVFLLDESAPTITETDRRFVDEHWEITLQVEDRWSVIRAAQMAYAGGETAPIDTRDRVFDQREETFLLKIPGEAEAQSVLFEVVDERGNLSTWTTEVAGR